MITTVLAPVLGFALAAALPATREEAAEKEPQYEMTTYQLVLLHARQNERPLGEREIVRLQEAHLAYLARMYDEGKVLLSGPLAGAGGLREVVVLTVGSTPEADEIMGKDPWVEAGRLTPEVHPWWAARGIVQKPVNYRHLEPCTLGLLRRPADAPDYPEETLKEIQAGHMANIRKMADSGDLVLAGPMGDDGMLRGIFIFRTLDAEHIRGLVAQDPTIRMGRLGAELYPWYLPKGSLPKP